MPSPNIAAHYPVGKGTAFENIIRSNGLYVPQWTTNGLYGLLRGFGMKTDFSSPKVGVH